MTDWGIAAVLAVVIAAILAVAVWKTTANKKGNNQ
jgi:hypothetical protein